MLVTRVEPLAVIGPEVAGRHVVHAFDLEVSVEGDVDPRTGMVVNLGDLKEVMRREVVGPLTGRRLDGSDGAPLAASPESLARLVWNRLAGKWEGVRLARVRLVGHPSPIVECREGEGMDVTRIYEFSASHRLHAPALSDAENVEVFGKCNNPNGHGHNYVLEVTLRGTPPAGEELLAADRFDRIVAEQVVDRWDHRHLNSDVPEFAGLNPTAEEIARLAYERLSGPFAALRRGDLRLHRVKLRETARNHVEYGGEVS